MESVMMTTAQIAPLLFAVSFTAGCGPSRPPALQPPTFDPLAVAQAVFERCDVDDDQRLSVDEQLAAPAVSTIAAELARDTDGSLSMDQLLDWLEQVKDSRVAMTSLSVVVRQNGRPIPNARVRMTPDVAMGNAFAKAEGVTESSGMAPMSAVGSNMPGVNCGLYNISIEVPGERTDETRGNEPAWGVAVGAGLPSGYQTVIEIAAD
jgi:hypothetical protein